MYNDPNQPPQQPPYGQQPPFQPGQPTSYGQQPPFQPEQQPYGQQPPYGAPPQQYGTPPQVPYGQPPYGAPPQKKSRKTLWIVLSIIGGILVLGCAACGLITFGVVKLGTQVAGPTLAMTEYYQALKTQNYAQAYTYLDSGSLTVQGQTVTPDLYATAEQAIDQKLGAVTNYTLSNIQAQTDTATITVRETRNQTRDITYSLRRVGNLWKITGGSSGEGLPATS
jgi:hypothetical protein